MSDETVVYLGNRAAIEVLNDPEDSYEQAAAEGRAVRTVRRPIDGAPRKNCTTFRIPADMTLAEAFLDITTRSWPRHSDASAPAWVASTDPGLAQLLAAQWKCEIREPDPAHEPSTRGDWWAARQGAPTTEGTG